MLKEYVCAHCLGHGEVEVHCEDERCAREWNHQNEGCVEGRAGPCPLCVSKHFPPKVLLPFEGPPATRELVVDVVQPRPTASLQFDDCYECHEAKGVGAVCSQHGDPWKPDVPCICGDGGVEPGRCPKHGTEFGKVK